MHQKTLAELTSALQQKEISSVELTQLYLDRIHKHDGQLNSFITVCDEHALQQAKAADAAIAQGQNTPLLGVPVAHKDIFCTDGIKTSCGSKMLDNFIAPYNATLIDKFNQTGSVMLGKLNMDEFAMGSSNENSYYGAVHNPWQDNTVPGGSSGGSASAVAARIAPASTGTDTGGSIRQPAALCGITGLKPTYGRVSRFGLIAFASSLDQAGPMTQTAEDAALMMNVMSGYDPKDSTSVDHPVPDYTASLNQSIEGLKIGLPKEFFDNLSDDIAKPMMEAKAVYEQLGATFVDVELPNSKLSIPSYYILAPAEASSNLARYDGVRYGYRCEDPQGLLDLYCRSRGEGFGPEVKRRIMIGTYVLSSGHIDAFYLKAQKIRQLIANDFKTAFQKADVILAPTSPSVAFKIGEKSTDPVTMYQSDIYTISINMAGLPAISVPCGFSQNLPVGMQLIGNYFDEPRLLNVAHQYQTQTDWHQQMPEQFNG
jgi:aspartyl-tRNA(Asn)/glutamyl-tRNA(Gln) amidotransferase subunit A